MIRFDGQHLFLTISDNPAHTKIVQQLKARFNTTANFSPATGQAVELFNLTLNVQFSRSAIIAHSQTSAGTVFEIEAKQVLVKNIDL
jgi:hypothetical protein